MTIKKETRYVDIEIPPDMEAATLFIQTIMSNNDAHVEKGVMDVLNVFTSSDYTFTEAIEIIMDVLSSVIAAFIEKLKNPMDPTATAFAESDASKIGNEVVYAITALLNAILAHVGKTSNGKPPHNNRQNEHEL
ncbi:MAG: hypothetical protein QXT84_06210 [Candidatus Bathyarchaeia archaeon]